MARAPRIPTFLMTLLVAAALTAHGPRPAAALVGTVKLIGGVEVVAVDFGHLADFTRYRLTADDIPDVAEQVVYRLESDSAAGFRLGLRLRPQIDVVWSRFEARSRYEVELDGTVLPEGSSGSSYPSVDVRFDLISVGLRPDIGAWGIHPLLRLGYGWVSYSQDEPFVAPRKLPADYSGSDKAIEVAAELNRRWGRVETGAGLRGVFWRWDAEDEFIPPRRTRALTWRFHLGMAF